MSQSLTGTQTTPGTGKVATGNVATSSSRQIAGPGTDFGIALDHALTAPAPVKFSRHAEERIRSRGIAMTPVDLDRLGRAVDAAAAKGSKDSLVVSGALTFVVNVPSRTVVTAMPTGAGSGSTQVFTKIDSAVLL
jgi:flagellar operon protein